MTLTSFLTVENMTRSTLMRFVFSDKQMPEIFILHILYWFQPLASLLYFSVTFMNRAVGILQICQEVNGDKSWVGLYWLEQHTHSHTWLDHLYCGLLDAPTHSAQIALPVSSMSLPAHMLSSPLNTLSVWQSSILITWALSKMITLLHFGLFYTLQNKGYLLALMVPRRTFNINVAFQI